MKVRLTALILAVLMLTSLCACSCGGNVQEDKEPVISESDSEIIDEIELDSAAKAIVRICGDYEAFDGDDFAAVLERYNELLYEAEILGYTPVIVFPDDELVRNIYSNLDLLDYRESGFENAPESLIEFGINDIRNRALDANSTLLLTQLKADRNANFDTIGFETRKGSVGSIADTLTEPDVDCGTILILKFHTSTPWDVLCSLPLGGWNECPSAYVLAAIAKRWYVETGALPALVSSRTLQFRAVKVLSADYAKELAAEMYCVAPQSELFACRSASGVGKHLQNAKVWRFDWIRTK